MHHAICNGDGWFCPKCGKAWDRDEETPDGCIQSEMFKPQPDDMPRIVAFVGKAGVGKTTACRALSQLGYKEVNFAEPIKQMTSVFLHYAGMSPAEIEACIHGAKKEIPIGRLNEKSPRYMLQTLETEWGRNMIDPDIWVDLLVRYMKSKPETRFVVGGVRFPNEIQALRMMDARVIRIVRDISEDVLPHVSETACDDFMMQEVLVNNSPTAEDFCLKVVSKIKGRAFA